MSSIPTAAGDGLRIPGAARRPRSDWLIAPQSFERSTGRVELAFKRRGDMTALAHLHQQGCGKARLPRPVDAGLAEAVLINLSGGLTGGDRLEWRVTWQTGAAAAVSGQAAEKIYRALGKSIAAIDTALHVASGALAFWLPQETILFDRARLVRRNRFAVAPGGRLLAIETTILGRRAMGETVGAGLFDEALEVRHDGRLLLAERQRFRGRMADLLPSPAVTGGADTLVSLLYVGEDATASLGRIRQALGDLPIAVSSPDPNLVLFRWLTMTSAGMRRRLVAALAALQDALDLPRYLPKVWSC